jgi:hypothetical protein
VGLSLSLALTALGSATRPAVAGKPGGGGGPTPPGTLYFAAGGGEWSMDGAGANRAALGPAPYSDGTLRWSRRLHGGVRWYLHHETVSGEAGPGPGARHDLFVVRQDGAVRLRLTSAPVMAYRWMCDWAADEDESGATIGFVGARWTGPSSADTVIPGTCGLYLARLLFDASGTPTGLEAEPEFATPLPAFGDPGRETPDVAGFFAWSPDMARIAFNRSSDPTNLWVAGVASGALALVGAGESPDWSPDGSKIVCRRFVDGSRPKVAIETIRPDGGGRTTLASVVHRKSASTTQFVHFPQWSPDGSHVAYRLAEWESVGSRTTWWTYRVGADGTGGTNLTPEVVPGASAGTYGAFLQEWR